MDGKFLFGCKKATLLSFATFNAATINPDLTYTRIWCLTTENNLYVRQKIIIWKNLRILFFNVFFNVQLIKNPLCLLKNDNLMLYFKMQLSLILLYDII